MSGKQEEIDTFDHTIQTPVKHLTIQGWYDDPEPPKGTACKCWNVVRMVVVSLYYYHRPCYISIHNAIF